MIIKCYSSHFTMEELFNKASSNINRLFSAVFSNNKHKINFSIVIESSGSNLRLVIFSFFVLLLLLSAWTPGSLATAKLNIKRSLIHRYCFLMALDRGYTDKQDSVTSRHRRQPRRREAEEGQPIGRSPLGRPAAPHQGDGWEEGGGGGAGPWNAPPLS